MVLDKKIPNDKRLALGSAFLVANAVVWYFFAAYILQENMSKVATNFLGVQLIWGIYFGTLAASLIVGAKLTNKIERQKLFVFWTLLGVASPAVLLILNFAEVRVAMFVAIIFAASAGLGMPNCMEYFVRSTNTASRGRYGGLILLLSFSCLFLLLMINGGIVLTASISIVWRLFGLLGVFTARPFKEVKEKIVNVSYSAVLSQRSFILYLIPWAMFSLVNNLVIPIQNNILTQAVNANLQIIEDAVIALSAVAAGFLIDRAGRKPVAVSGFVLLGIGYGFLGLFPKEMISWYFYSVFDGISWGILFVLFVVCVWGELNPNAPTDKYFAIGILPFFIAEFMSHALTNYISLGISANALFSFVAFFLFVAVLPLLYAPETLPEKLMKDRELKGYVEKAIKQAQKETGKNQMKDSVKTDNEHAELKEESEESSEYKEALKLAEKYY
jgi:MFS family permease